MKFNNIKNLIVPSHKSQTKNRGINVLRDWKIILIVSIAIVFMLIAWSLILLQRIKNDELFKNNPNSVITKSAVNQNKLEEVNGHFLEKAKKHESIINTPIKIADPSR